MRFEIRSDISFDIKLPTWFDADRIAGCGHADTIVVFAIVQVFDMLGETMTKGRAMIEMAGNLRAVANRLAG